MSRRPTFNNAALPTFVAALICANATTSALAQQIDIPAPAGSDHFGASVTVLGNGNFVVTDCLSSAPSKGNVYLFRPTGELISTLSGRSATDCIGRGRSGIRRVGDKNFIVVSPSWSDDGLEFAGAVTWVDGDKGLNGKVTSANSLTGTSAHERFGTDVVVLQSGHYVACSSTWSNGAVANAGAVVWGDGNKGVSGPVSPMNALVGSRNNDRVGRGEIPCSILELHNGNVVVHSPSWDDGDTTDVGAVTLMDGEKGIVGPVTSANSLIGSQAGDRVGELFSARLANGHFVVRSPYWDHGSMIDAGAVTWVDGNAGLTGPVSPGNSLVGTLGLQMVGFFPITELSNGNYVVRVPTWGDAAANMGAVVFGPGDTGVSGPISPTIAAVGTHANDYVGSSVTALSDGNYVISSPSWRNPSTGHANVGAVTWANGSTGMTGAISLDNSMVGAKANDSVGRQVTPLPNGDYVVTSQYWQNGPNTESGAVTLLRGGGPSTGVIGPSNSLVGTETDEWIGDGGITVLTNGNFVVGSRRWSDGGSRPNAGAATFVDAQAGIHGTISAANSLVGSLPYEGLGSNVFALANGNYVVLSTGWNSGAGAITWGDGVLGVAGVVSLANSLVGSAPGDLTSPPYYPLGAGMDFIPLAGGNYVAGVAGLDTDHVNAGAVLWGSGWRGSSGLISSASIVAGSHSGEWLGDITEVSDNSFVVNVPMRQNGATQNAGAVALFRGNSAAAAALSPLNAVFGVSTHGSSSRMSYAYDHQNDALIVGRPADRIVTRLRADALFAHGYD